MMKSKILLALLVSLIAILPLTSHARLSNNQVKYTESSLLKSTSNQYWFGTESHIWNLNPGNVGIGTGFYPSLAKLTVAGDVSATAYRLGDIDIITNTKLIRAAKGSAINPSFSFYDDVNTGIFSSNQNQIAFAVNGIEKIRLNENGYLGINTEEPKAPLHVRKEDIFINYQNATLIIEDTTSTIDLISQNGNSNTINFRNSLGGDGFIKYEYFLDGQVPKYKMNFSSIGGFYFDNNLDVNGTIRGQHQASNGQSGLTKSYSLKDSSGSNCQMHFVNGLLVESSCLETSSNPNPPIR